MNRRRTNGDRDRIGGPVKGDAKPFRPAADRPAAATATAPALEARTIADVRRRLIPIVLLLYFVAYLDRNNVGFAATDLRRNLGITASGFGFGAGLFFIGYVLMEIPSNVAMHALGARRWIARILLTWGVLATAMAFARGPWSFAALRFGLSAAEAGFFPAILYYFTLWFPAAARTRVLGLFVLAQPLANAIGAPVSGWLLELDGFGGLHGWQWLFIVEGVPAIILGVLTPMLLTDRPSDARWLDAAQRDCLRRLIEADARGAIGRPGSFRDGLRDRRFAVYALLNFGMVCGIYGLGLWLPTIIHALGGGSSARTGLLVLIPYGAAALAVYPWSRSAARSGRLAIHAAAAMVLGGLGLLGAGSTLASSPTVAILFLSLAAIGIYAAIGPLLSMPSNLASGAAAATGLAVVNCLGNIGGFISPTIVGLLKQGRGGGDRAALVFLAGCLLLTGAAVWCYGRNRPEGRLPPAP